MFQETRLTHLLAHGIPDSFKTIADCQVSHGPDSTVT